MKAARLYRRDASHVILPSASPRFGFGIEPLLFDLGIIKCLVERDLPFALASSFRGCRNKEVFWSPSDRFDTFRFNDYSDTLIHIARQLERQGNNVYPSSYEVAYLENKALMYREFERRGVRFPKTYIFEDRAQVDPQQIDYPVICKGEHSSGSQDITRINDAGALSEFLDRRAESKGKERIIIQQLLEIRRDLRVVIVGDEVVSHYWRINHSAEWRPTASCYGSEIRFDEFPEEWRDFILDQHRRLALVVGAFDFAWDNDDLDTAPYVLEVSPRFSPSPPLSPDSRISYNQQKKKLLSRNSYAIRQVDQIFDISVRILNSLNKVTCARTN